MSCGRPPEGGLERVDNEWTGGGRLKCHNFVDVFYGWPLVVLLSVTAQKHLLVFLCAGANE